MQGLLSELGKDSSMFISPDDLPLPREYRMFSLEGLIQQPPLDIAARTVVFLDCGNLDRNSASVLRDAGLRLVIGSNVAGQELRYDAGSRVRAPNMLQIVNRVMNSMEREMLKAQSPLVDVMIRPRLSIQNPLDFNRVDEFIAEGERAARSELAETTVPIDLVGALR